MGNAPLHLSDADAAYALSHAYSYASESPSYGHLAMDYARWYFDRHARHAEDLSDFPDHSREWLIWRGQVAA